MAQSGATAQYLASRSNLKSLCSPFMCSMFVFHKPNRETLYHFDAKNQDVHKQIQNEKSKVQNCSVKFKITKLSRPEGQVSPRFFMFHMLNGGLGTQDCGLVTSSLQSQPSPRDLLA